MNRPLTTVLREACARARRAPRRLFGDARGGAAVLFALVLPVGLGFVALGLETGYWYASRRGVQTAADAGAIAGAYQVLFSGDIAGTSGYAQTLNARINTAVTEEAQRNGYSGTPTVNKPPASGAYAGDNNAVEVILSEPRNLLFTKVFLDSNINIAARAVATLTQSSEACVLSLSPTASGAVSNSGSPNVNLTGWAVAVNSNSSSAMSLTGGSLMTTECVSIVGGLDTSGGATLNTTCGAPQVGVLPVEDPYASLADPPSFMTSDCDYSGGYTPPSGSTLDPFSGLTSGQLVFCDGLTLQGTVDLNPGVYYIAGGKLKINAGANVTGSGVTFVLTRNPINASGPVKWASVDISGGGTVDLSAPTSGPYAGILMYQDRNTPTSPTHNNSITGDSSTELTGALYFPTNDLAFRGGSATTGNCAQLIAQKVVFTAGAGSISTNLNNTCSGDGMQTISVKGKISLVE